MKKVLLLCSGSPLRAAIAEEILRKNIDINLDLELASAGLEKVDIINKTVIKILEEEGIDAKVLKPKVLDEVAEMDFDLIITMFAYSKEICPKFPKVVPTLHIEFPMIINENEVAYKALIEKVKTKVKEVLLKELF